MPHATNPPASGIQAIILCGPGVSLNTFTSKPEEFPKALVPIANRPMVWYPLDWCYRMGVTNINLVTPPGSLKALDAALSQNPHLTSLPHPRADIIAPQDLTDTSGTADILRLPEVQSVIQGDFLLLPCDLVSELPGEPLLDSWMINTNSSQSRKFSSAGDNDLTTKGGLGVWFDTRGVDYAKGAETDLIITAPASEPVTRPAKSSIQSNVSKLLFTSTMDTVRDTMEEKAGLPLRTGIVRKHGRLKIGTTIRAAHVYLFPHWVLQLARQNEDFESISEDLVGWWAKATWQDGLAEKLHMDSVDVSFRSKKTSSIDTQVHHLRPEDTMDSYSTTCVTTLNPGSNRKGLPSLYSYIHPTTSPYLIRRVDTPAILLSTSLRLASIDWNPENGADTVPNPHSHPQKIMTDSSLIAPHTTIHEQSTLIAPNTSVAKHCTIKSSCIGANCSIAEGVRITGCLLMDGAKVGSKSVLQDSILGPRCVVGKGVRLEGCEVQQDYRIEDGSIGSKGEKFCVFEGLENGLEAMSQDDAPTDMSEA